jgi:hypothetical protein
MLRNSMEYDEHVPAIIKHYARLCADLERPTAVQLAVSE